MLIPDEIRKSNLPNWLRHWTYELAIETSALCGGKDCLSPKVTVVYANIDKVRADSGRSLQQFSDEVLGRDTTSETQKLKAALATNPSGLWGGAGQPLQEGNLLYAVYEGGAKGNWLLGALFLSIAILSLAGIIRINHIVIKVFLIFLAMVFALLAVVFLVGIRGLTDPSSAMPFMEQATQVTVNILNGIDPTLEPSGKTAITQADAVPLTTLGIFGFVAIGVGIIGMLLIRRKK